MNTLTFHIRPATRADMTALWEVRYAVRENTLTPGRIGDEELLRSIEADGRGWVAVSDAIPDSPDSGDRVLGFAIGLNTGNVWALFVRPEAEGRGIGRALHADMLAWFATQPLDALWLGTDPHSRAYGFYLAHDWTPVGPHGADEVRLERANRRSAGPASR